MEGEERNPAPRFQLTHCFCLTLRQGVIIIAALELTTFVSLITYNGVMLQKAGRFQYMIVLDDLLEIIIHFVVAMLLVVGVWRERRQLVWAWVYTRIVVLGTDIITLLVATAVILDWPYVVYGIMLVPIYAVFIVVVRSYALHLKARDNKDPTDGATRISQDTEAIPVTATQ
ncbi:hypothetical protein Pmani_001204 [Petrolisthes manimaculis]|uniref:Uncharacterized protein n=1 Tax=Petrolisthes manimaculis TaxID=1843537 RepID=A0AAE1QKZ6_9EUCA|nr:hypothetical protein Pmani_010747 [Petrolisthes manimaculis]KAK4328376.1 hypothetical protein Pmani_001204 [Petrolisthes manimaculis]